MNKTIAKSSTVRTKDKNDAVGGRIYFLDLAAGRVLSANTDGSDLKTIAVEGRKLPDGLVVDSVAGHLYWTNMGSPSANDGSDLPFRS